MRKILPVLVLSLMALPALAADVSGTWDINGAIQPHCTITQSGSQLSGSCKGPQAEGPLDGSSDGQTVKFTFRRTGLRGGQLAPVTFSGTVNGDNMTGTLTAGQARGSFTAHRAGGGAQTASAPAPAPQTPAAPPVPPPGINSAPPKTVWDTDVDGSAVHQLTGMVCPVGTSNGALKRNQLAMYDHTGFDVSCNYRTAGADITIYLTYRNPSLLQQTFEGAKQALMKNALSATPRAGTLTAPAGLSWLQAAYDEEGGATRSEILYTQLSGWQYEIRVTFRPGAEAEAAVTAGIADLTATVRRTAGPHLTACNGTQPLDGTGPRNRDLNALQPLAGAAASVTAHTVSTPKPDAVWCSDIGFGIGTGSYVWWHNIGPAGDGPVIRITNVAGGNTVFVVRFPLDVATALAEKMGKNVPGSGDGYAVVVDDAQSSRIAGLFDGRPSFKDVTGLVLVGSAFGVYAEINKADKHITLYAPF